MMENILYLVLVLLTVYFLVRISLDLRKWLIVKISFELDCLFEDRFAVLKKQMEERFYVAYRSLEKEIEVKFFELAKNNNSYFQKNNLAKNEEVLQTKEETPPSQTKDFWQDLERLRETRSLIDQGNQSEYRNIQELAELPPLDAWREIDMAIADLEQRKQNPASIGVTGKESQI